MRWHRLLYCYCATQTQKNNSVELIVRSHNRIATVDLIIRLSRTAETISSGGGGGGIRKWLKDSRGQAE